MKLVPSAKAGLGLCHFRPPGTSVPGFHISRLRGYICMALNPPLLRESLINRCSENAILTHILPCRAFGSRGYAAGT